MTISVVIPAYNARNYIGQTIGSVLCQTYDGRIELIIIDDCSTDDTGAIVRRHMKNNSGLLRDIRYYRNKVNKGVAYSRNRGVRKARGKYIAFLDADDMWEPSLLTRSIAALNNSKARFVYCSRSLMSKEGEPTGRIIWSKRVVYYRDLLPYNPINCSSVVMERRLALSYPMGLSNLHEDYLQWLTILRDGGFAFGIKEPLLRSRISDGSKSGNKLRSAHMHFRTLLAIGLPFWQAVLYFYCYVVTGIKKYYWEA